MPLINLKIKQLFVKNCVDIIPTTCLTVEMKLETYIREKDITVESVAAQCGCSVQNVYYWMNGRHSPSKEHMQRIFELTGGAVTANDFYGIEAETPQSLIDTLTQAYNGVY